MLLCRCAAVSAVSCKIFVMFRCILSIVVAKVTTSTSIYRTICDGVVYQMSLKLLSTAIDYLYLL